MIIYFCFCFKGGAGLVLGAGIPLAQAYRGKNDPMAWMMGGFAAGAVFALKSKLSLIIYNVSSRIAQKPLELSSCNLSVTRSSPGHH